MRQKVENVMSSTLVKQSSLFSKVSALINMTKKVQFTCDFSDRAALKLHYAKKHTTTNNIENF